VEAFAQEVEAFVQKLEMEGEPAVEYKEGGPLVEYKERTLALLRDVISIPSLIALATVLKKDNCDRILLCKIFLTRTVFSIGKLHLTYALTVASCARLTLPSSWNP
jgi:hypothetical protein